MNTHAYKTTETISNAVANGMAVQQGVEHEGTLQLEDNRPEAIAQRKIQDAANNSPQVTQLKAVQAMVNSSKQVKQLRTVQAMANDGIYNTAQRKEINEEETIQQKFNTVQRKRKRTEDKEKLTEGHLHPAIQRVVDETVPINSRIIIDSKATPDYGDEGIIRRVYAGKPSSMAVEFDNETGVLYRVYFHEMSIIKDTGISESGSSSSSSSMKKSGFSDPQYPSLIFTINEESTKEIEEDCYDVTAAGLENPATVMKQDGIYVDIKDNKDWIPKMAGEKEGLSKKLKTTLNSIAKKNFGERCHEVAGEMQDAFKAQNLKSKVMEICTTAAPKDGDHIMVMGSRVRNHYVNLLNDLIYDSGTGEHGVPWQEYLDRLQDANEDRKLEYKVAKPI